MKCPKCGQETRGIKLNGKLFCGFCGEVIKDSVEILEESYQDQPINVVAPERIEPKIIAEGMAPGKSEKTEAPMTDLPGEVTPAIDGEHRAKRKITLRNKTIAKHDRPRVDSHGFDLILNEPDPIDKPELAAPLEMLVEKPVEVATGNEREEAKKGETNYNLLSKKELNDIETKRKQKQQALAEYLRQTSGTTGQKKKKKKSKTKAKRRWLVFGAISLCATLVFAALVYYVNFYAVKEERIASDLKQKASFPYQVPSGIPEGYRLSYLSDSNSNYVKYFYVFANDDKRYISVKIEPTDVAPSDVLDKIIKNEEVDFTQISANGLEFWQTKNNKIYVVKNGLLYSFENSGELFADSFLRFAKETLL